MYIQKPGFREFGQPLGSNFGRSFGQPGRASYQERLLATQPANLIACWPLSELSGSVAVNTEGTAARNGTYGSGVTLNARPFLDGSPAPSFDGTANAFVNVFSASLAAAFNNQELTILIWVYLSAANLASAGVMTEAQIGVNSSNLIRMRKGAANRLDVSYVAGGVTKNVVHTDATNYHDQWVFHAMTVSKSNNRLRGYTFGVQRGADAAIPDTWVGTLANTAQFRDIGLEAATSMNGNLKYPALWTTELTPSEIAALASV